MGGGGLCPQTSYQVSVFCNNCYFLNFNHWKYGFYVNVGKSMLLNEVVYLRCLLKLYAPTIFKIMTLSAKKASASGDCVPKNSYQILYFLHIL